LDRIRRQARMAAATIGLPHQWEAMPDIADRQRHPPDGRRAAEPAG
jgi:hypothetical protein